MKFNRLSPENEKAFFDEMKNEGFINVKWLSDERGYVGLSNYIFTTGLVFGIDRLGYEGRWCFPKERHAEAVLAYTLWDGDSDPMGEWIKYKGKGGEYTNPKLVTK